MLALRTSRPKPDKGPEAAVRQPAVPRADGRSRGPYRHNPSLPGARTRLGQETTCVAGLWSSFLRSHPCGSLGFCVVGAWTRTSQRGGYFLADEPCKVPTLPQLADTPFLEKPPLSYLDVGSRNRGIRRFAAGRAPRTSSTPAIGGTRDRRARFSHGPRYCSH